MPANISGVRLGKAFVEVGALDRTQRVLASIEGQFRRWTANLGKVVLAGAAGLAAMGATAFALAKRFASVGDEINKLSARTGASTEFLSELRFAASQSDVAFQSAGAAIFRMTRRIGNARTETGPAVRALEELNLQADRLSEMDVEDQFLTLADALKGVDNESRKLQLGFEIFGDNFRQIVPLLEGGSEGIETLRKEARELGLTMDQVTADRASKLTDTLDKLKFIVENLVIRFGSEFADVIETGANRIVKLTKAVIQFSQANKPLIQGMLQVSMSWDLIVRSMELSWLDFSNFVIDLAAKTVSSILGFYRDMAFKIGNQMAKIPGMQGAANQFTMAGLGFMAAGLEFDKQASGFLKGRQSLRKERNKELQELIDGLTGVSDGLPAIDDIIDRRTPGPDFGSASRSQSAVQALLKGSAQAATAAIERGQKTIQQKQLQVQQEQLEALKGIRKELEDDVGEAGDDFRGVD